VEYGKPEVVLDKLNHKARSKVGRSITPSYGIIDAQSVKTQYASEEIGIDAGKKVKGHKCYIIVDVLGNLLHIQVHAANISDTKAAGDVFERMSEKSLQLMFTRVMQVIVEQQSIL